MPDAPEQQESYDELIDRLLALPDRDSRADFLRQHDLLDSEGLDTLLDRADELLNRDPGRARKLAELCMEFAESADAPAAIPKASYVIAGACDLNGDFGKALELTRQAHDGYLLLGMDLEALRTESGRMLTLLWMGDYEESLGVGERTLERIGALDLEGEKERDGRLLVALVHQNRGLCYEFTGRYDLALEAYRASERLYEDLNLPERRGEVSSNRGIMLLNLGRGAEALEVFEEAAELFDEAGQSLSLVGAVINLGFTNLQLGNYVRSLEYFERARSMLDPLETVATEQKLLLDMADAYLALNLYAEASALYGEILEFPVDGDSSYERAWALWGMGAALKSEGASDAARESLSQAGELFARSGNVPLRAGVMLEKAALLARDERDLALKTAEEALELVSGSDEWPLQRIFCALTVAEFLLPDTERAERCLREIEPLLAGTSLPQLRYRFDERLAQILNARGDPDEAARLYRAAISGIERLRGMVTRDSIRASFLSDKMSVYDGLLELTLNRASSDDITEAFALSEQAKSRALTDLVSGITVSATAPLSNPELGDELETLQADLSVVYNRLLGGRMEPEDDGLPAPNLQKRAVELEGEISRLRLRIAASGTESADPFDVQTAQGFSSDNLPPGVVLLAYHTLGDEILAFVVSGDGIGSKRRVGSVSKVRDILRRLDSQWDRFRSGQTFSERQMTMLERSTNRVLAALYDELIRPVELLLEDAAKRLKTSDGEVPRLAIIPHGPLHQAPFHAFFDGAKYLLDRFEISYAPSATVFALCQRKESRSPDRALAIGVSDDLIPTANDEAIAVAGLFSDSELLLDERATPEALEKSVAGCGVVHLACHGMFRSDNPMFSALKLHEQWMLAHDAMGLNLDGAVVALSACESGRNVVVGGDEILGLTRAFLGARAATLLVSLWIVHDDTTSSLMRRFYERLISGVNPARALRFAQLKTREEHPHPYYWAPFVTVGKR